MSRTNPTHCTCWQQERTKHVLFLLLLLFNRLFAHLINTANGPDRLTGFEKNCLLCQDTEFFPSFSPNGDPHQLPWLLTVCIPVSLLETKSVPGGFWPVSLYRCRRQIKLCLEATAKKNMILFLGSSWILFFWILFVFFRFCVFHFIFHLYGFWSSRMLL